MALLLTRAPPRLSRLIQAAPRFYSSSPPWLTSILSSPTPPPRIAHWTPSPTPIPAPDPRRIHILGPGNIGRLYAAHLSLTHPVTLILHRRELLDAWRGIELSRQGVVTLYHHNISVEYWDDADASHEGWHARDIGRVENLVVATKADAALAQVDRLRGHLDARSTVAFAQNGMSRMWPPHGPACAAHRWGKDSPAFAACITTHGVLSRGPFRSEHASVADAKVGLVLPGGSEDASGSNGLVDAIASAPGLLSQRVSRADLWILQLEKLVVNSVVNPLTAVVRCKNGVLFADEDEGAVYVRVMDRLLRETSAVCRALAQHPSIAEGILPGGSGAKLDERFSFAALRRMLWAVGRKVADNTSSMLQDVRAGKTTEVREFNGWIVDTARFLEGEGAGSRLDVSAHQALIHLVESGQTLDADGLGKALLS